MEKQLQKTIQENYNRLSRWYDLISGAGEERFRDTGISLLNPQAGENILEIGCGTGQSLNKLSQLVTSDGNIIGIDLSPGMLFQAKKKFPPSPFSPTLINGSALSLPFRNSCFDACFISFTIELFPDHLIKTTLEEVERILKPNGRLSIVSMAVSDQKTLITRLYDWAHQKFPQTIDCRPINSANFITHTHLIPQKSLQQKMWGLPVNIDLFCKIVKP